MKKIQKLITSSLVVLTLVIGFVGLTTSNASAANYVTNGKVYIVFDVPWWVKSSKQGATLTVQVGSKSETKKISKPGSYRFTVTSSAASSKSKQEVTVKYQDCLNSKSTSFYVTGKDLKGIFIFNKKFKVKLNYQFGAFVKSLSIK